MSTPPALRGPWRIREARSVYANSWIEVTHHEVVRPDGLDGIYGTVHFKNSALGILPIDSEGHTWLVGQYRFPLDLYSWEIPEGGGPLADEPLAAAKRELKEETGLTAKTWKKLLTLHLSNSVTDEVAHAYLATDLTAGAAAPEGSEELALKRLPFSEALAMALDGRITDAFAVATILRAHVWLTSGH